MFCLSQELSEADFEMTDAQVPPTLEKGKTGKKFDVEKTTPAKTSTSSNSSSDDDEMLDGDDKTHTMWRCKFENRTLPSTCCVP